MIDREAEMATLILTPPKPRKKRKRKDRKKKVKNKKTRGPLPRIAVFGERKVV